MPADDPPTFLPVAVPAARAGRSPIARIRQLFARAPLPVDTKLPRPPAAGLYVDAETSRATSRRAASSPAFSTTGRPTEFNAVDQALQVAVAELGLPTLYAVA